MEFKEEDKIFLCSRCNIKKEDLIEVKGNTYNEIMSNLKNLKKEAVKKHKNK